MEIASGQNLWVLPPHFGLWIPARTLHSIRMPEQVFMRTLYLRPGLFQSWSGCTVFHVTPLLRELIFEITRMGSLRTRKRLDNAFREILASQLARATPVPIGIELPKDPRALTVAESMLNNLADRRTLPSLCRVAGVSVRTVQRIFQREVGLDFESWRRQVRLMQGIQLLVSGRSIKETADAVGYQDSTTFIELFRSTFGTTPKSWLVRLHNYSSTDRLSPARVDSPQPSFPTASKTIRSVGD